MSTLNVQTSRKRTSTDGVLRREDSFSLDQSGTFKTKRRSFKFHQKFNQISSIFVYFALRSVAVWHHSWIHEYFKRILKRIHRREQHIRVRQSIKYLFIGLWFFSLLFFYSNLNLHSMEQRWQKIKIDSRYLYYNYETSCIYVSTYIKWRWYIMLHLAIFFIPFKFSSEVCYIIKK